MNKALLLGLIGLVSCAQDTATPPAASNSPSFASPERVVIQGWSDHAMEPFLSRDGRYLFFNNSNEPDVDTDLHFAERIDDLTFQYRGSVSGANTTALDAVASMDRDGLLYFVSTRSYAETASTIYRGSFADGVVRDVGLVPGVSSGIPGRVNFDAEISPDGEALWFVDSEFGPGGPKTADLALALRSGQGFAPVDATRVLGRVNTAALEYAPATSASGLELYFTRAQGAEPALFFASRPSPADPFGEPVRITAASGFVEAPSLSADEQSLYYHKREGSLFVIFRLTVER